MAASMARKVFEVSKTSDIILFTDRRPNSAVDLLTVFAFRRHAVNPTRTAVHVLCFERRIHFWKERLQHILQDRVFFHNFVDDFSNGKGFDTNNATSSLHEAVRKLGPSVCHHVIIFDSTFLLLALTIREFCLLLVNMASQITEAAGGVVQTSIGLLHHADLFDSHSERALKAISSSSVSIVSSSENKLGEEEFVCCIDHMRHQDSHCRQLEKITISQDWRTTYGPADSTRNSERIVVKNETDDPASNLSFNLRLTSEERTARNQVQLPHSRGGGVIYYEPDEADDIDYEDPDE